jgi:hypothetical protein
VSPLTRSRTVGSSKRTFIRAVKPFRFLEGPRPGRILVGDNVMLSRDGLLVIAEVQSSPIGTAAALALAKALRLVPAG